MSQRFTHLAKRPNKRHPSKTNYTAHKKGTFLYCFYPSPPPPFYRKNTLEQQKSREGGKNPFQLTERWKL